MIQRKRERESLGSPKEAEMVCLGYEGSEEEVIIYNV